MAINIAPKKYFPSYYEKFKLDYIPSLILPNQRQRYLREKAFIIFSHWAKPTARSRIHTTWHLIPRVFFPLISLPPYF